MSEDEHEHEHDAEFFPTLLFPTDDPVFVLGFECGRVWALLREHPEVVRVETMHGENAEMILRIAESCRRTVISDEIGNGWLSVLFGAVGEPLPDVSDDDPTIET